MKNANVSYFRQSDDWIEMKINNNRWQKNSDLFPSTSKATLWRHFYLLLLKETEVQSPGFEDYVSSQSVRSELRWWRQHHQKSAAAAKHSETLRALL